MSLGFSATFWACQNPQNTTQQASNLPIYNTETKDTLPSDNIALHDKNNTQEEDVQKIDTPKESSYKRSPLGKGYEDATVHLKDLLPQEGDVYNVIPFKFLAPPYYFFNVDRHDTRDANPDSIVLHIDEGIIDRTKIENLEKILRYIDLSQGTEVPARDIAKIVQCFLPASAAVFTDDQEPVLKRPAISKPVLSHHDDTIKLDFSYAKDGRKMNIVSCAMLVDAKGRVNLECKDLPLNN